jgi:hypothetical protein
MPGIPDASNTAFHRTKINDDAVRHKAWKTAVSRSTRQVVLSKRSRICIASFFITGRYGSQEERQHGSASTICRPRSHASGGIYEAPKIQGFRVNA